MDRFRLLERVGSGGMGTVYRAFDERLQRQVAVKEITSSDPARVTREAQAAARLNHPGIVTLYELGSEGGRALLVSELVEGATLSELARCGDLCDREVAEFGADVCEALAHAHERGVIHRDVKPQNVIVRVDDGAGRRGKLMDFGIASLLGAPTLTATGEVVGTLAYMAPEQAAGLSVSEASDIYSLALTLYECWTGANPVAGDTPAQTARQIGGSIPSLRDYRPDLPTHLTDCLDACLEPDPQVRPPLEELDQHLDASIPRLDAHAAVPVWEDRDESRVRERGAILRVAQLAALCAWGITVMLLAVAADRPGLALVLAALSAPAILVASWLPWAGIPVCAPLLGAASAGAAPPSPARAARCVSARPWAPWVGAGCCRHPLPLAWARPRAWWMTRRPAGAGRPGTPPVECLHLCSLPRRSSERRYSRRPRSLWAWFSAPATSPWRCWGPCSGRPVWMPRCAWSATGVSRACPWPPWPPPQSR